MAVTDQYIHTDSKTASLPNTSFFLHIHNKPSVRNRTIPKESHHSSPGGLIHKLPSAKTPSEEAHLAKPTHL